MIQVPHLSHNHHEQKVLCEIRLRARERRNEDNCWIACTAKAIDDGHDVAVFFAAAGTRLLDPSYISQLNEKMGQGSNIVSQMMASIVENATLYCSFASVKATLGVNEGDGALIVEDEDIKWSGPPGVIELSSGSEVQLVY